MNDVWDPVVGSARAGQNSPPANLSSATERPLRPLTFRQDHVNNISQSGSVTKFPDGQRKYRNAEEHDITAHHGESVVDHHVLDSFLRQSDVFIN